VSLLLGLTPLLAYCVVAPLSLSLALWLAFAAAFTLAMRGFAAHRRVRLLDGTGLAVFGALVLYNGFLEPGMTLARVSMVVEAIFFVVVMWSLLARRPLTAQYLPPQENDTAFLTRANTILSGAWAATFAAMAGMQATSTILHTVSPAWASGTGLVVLAGALAFTWQFVAYIEKRSRKAPAPGRR